MRKPNMHNMQMGELKLMKTDKRQLDGYNVVGTSAAKSMQELSETVKQQKIHVDEVNKQLENTSYRTREWPMACFIIERCFYYIASAS